jgi:two-component system KDP operon response regulator KdpE
MDPEGYRVQAERLARLAAGTGQPTFDVGDLHVDVAARQVSVGGKEIRLTRTQFNLLAALVRHAGKVLTHRQLLREVWGPGATEYHYVRVYMRQLRHKLEPDPARPRYLVTEIGVGYRLCAE